MAEIVELSAHCTIEMEEVLNSGRDEEPIPNKLFPPIRKPAQPEEVKDSGTDIHEGE